MNKNVVFLLVPLLAIAVSGIVLKDGLMAQTIDPVEEVATLNAVHGIPDAEVDVCVRGEATEDEFAKVLEGFNFMDIEVLEAPAGTYDIAVVPAGEACDSPISGLTADNLALVAGDNVSIIAHLAENGEGFTLTFGKNETFQLEHQRTSLITAYHAAAAPPVDIRAGKFHPVQEFFTFMGNGEFGSHDVLRPAQYLVAVIPAGEPSTGAVVEAQLQMYEGSHTIVYVVGSLEDGTHALLTQRFSLKETDKLY